MTTNAARDTDYFGELMQREEAVPSEKTCKLLLRMPKDMNDVKDAAKCITTDTAIMLITDALDSATLVRAIDYLRGFTDSCQGKVRRSASNGIMIAPYSVSISGSTAETLYGNPEYDEEIENEYYDFQ